MPRPELERLASLLACLPIPAAPSRSLSVGCGEFPEYALLRDRWSDWLHIGLDWDGQELPHQVPCVRADGQKLPFATLFSLILIRHPDLARHPQHWEAILRQIPAYLAPQGVLMVSTFSYAEMTFAQQNIALQRLILTPHQLAAPDLVSHDRYVLAYQTNVLMKTVNGAPKNLTT